MALLLGIWGRVGPPSLSISAQAHGLLCRHNGHQVYATPIPTFS